MPSRRRPPKRDVLVRMKERRDFGHQFGRIPIITGNDGTQVLLEEIAVRNSASRASARSLLAARNRQMAARCGVTEVPTLVRMEDGEKKDVLAVG